MDNPEPSSQDMVKEDGRSKKKPRRRMKAVYSKIREQMEFYFGDANLHKDRFLKKSIEMTSDGYIELSTFLKFNKIKCHTDDVKTLADALSYKSDLLQINDSKTHVRRITPITEPKNVNERTVYVEYLPQNIDHEWVKKLFSSCGKVAYVSLPRYASTGDMKGFAFVEFETIEGAVAACEALNNPPADAIHRVGMFPKTSTQLSAIKKHLPEDQVKATEEKAKEIVLSEKVSDIKTEENSAPVHEVDNVAGSVILKTEHGKLKRQRANSENSVDLASDQSLPPVKRKKPEVSFDLPLEESKPTENENAQSGSKKKSRKRKNRSKTIDIVPSDSGNPVKNVESEIDDNDEKVPEKKQKIDSVIDSNKLDKESDGEKGTEEETLSETDGKTTQDEKENGGKKKKRFRKKKARKEKVVPELRVIPKEEWLVLRNEYLKLQKTSVSMLKKTLGELKQHKTCKKEADEEKKKKSKEIKFTPDAIIKVSSNLPMARKKLKECLGEGYQIAYIDVKDGLQEGHIRCTDADSAKKISMATTEGYTFTLVSGEEERMYWAKLVTDRETKLNTKCKHKKRGHQKVMEKAQKASIANVEKKHIVFDDE